MAKVNRKAMFFEVVVQSCIKNSALDEGRS